MTKRRKQQLADKRCGATKKNGLATRHICGRAKGHKGRHCCKVIVNAFSTCDANWAIRASKGKTR